MSEKSLQGVSVLLVEDERVLAETLSYLLQQEGAIVVLASDGEEGIRRFCEGAFDVILLDIMMPKYSGFEVCERIRVLSDVPILMLTAKDDDDDVVRGFEVGADDYVTKPYSLRQLLARVKAILRRSSTQRESEMLHLACLRMDTKQHVLWVGERSVTLSPKEFDLLEYFLLNPEQLLTRHQIMDHLWAHSDLADTKTLDVHIKRLRSKIEMNPSKPQLLVTVRGIGYRLTEENLR